MNPPERISDYSKLNSTDVRILVALLLGPMAGYELARQVEKDTGTDRGSMSINGVQYSLKRMLQGGYVEQIASPYSRSGYVYRITTKGRKSISEEAKVLGRTIRHITDRQSR